MKIFQNTIVFNIMWKKQREKEIEVERGGERGGEREGSGRVGRG